MSDNCDNIAPFLLLKLHPCGLASVALPLYAVCKNRTFFTLKNLSCEVVQLLKRKHFHSSGDLGGTCVICVASIARWHCKCSFWYHSDSCECQDVWQERCQDLDMNYIYGQFPFIMWLFWILAAENPLWTVRPKRNWMPPAILPWSNWLKWGDSLCRTGEYLTALVWRDEEEHTDSYAWSIKRNLVISLMNMDVM
jgi:hypothetical protein